MEELGNEGEDGFEPKVEEEEPDGEQDDEEGPDGVVVGAVEDGGVGENDDACVGEGARDPEGAVVADVGAGALALEDDEGEHDEAERLPGSVDDPAPEDADREALV